MSILSVIKYLFLLIVGVIVVVIAQYNRELVTLHSPWDDYNFSLPLYILIFIVLIFGIFLGGIVSLVYRFKIYSNSYRDKKLIDALENEVASLKFMESIKQDEADMPTKLVEQ